MNVPERRKAGNAHGIGLHRLSENNGNMLENVALIYSEKMEKVQMDLQEKYSFSRRRISCSLAKAISREKLEKGEILYELYHRFSLCDGNLSPYDSIQGIKLSDERH